MAYFSLHNHTAASNIRFLDSINKPEEMVEKAIKLGFGGIAFTDHEALSSAISVLKIRDAIKKDHPDFKIIFGNEIYLIDESEVKNTKKYYHFILLAKDIEGWEQLRELSSFAWENSYMEKGQVRVPTTYQKLEEVVSRNPGHLYASTACFTKGHRVLTIDGLKNIEDILPGDKVMTSDGTYQEVITPTSRLYEGDGVSLKFRHSLEEITCTSNHKFLVAKYNTHKKEYFTDWVEAKDLKINDKCLNLFPEYKYSNQKVFDISELIEEFSKDRPLCAKNTYYLNKKIVLTPVIMRLYGLWLGDGSVASEDSKNPYRVTISFNESEYDDYKNFVYEGLSQLGTFNPNIFYKKDQHKIEMVIYSVELAKLLRYISNNGKSDSKFIYTKLLHISREMDAEILYGYLLADGYYRARIMDEKYITEETVDVTVSCKLFDDITELYYSVGFIPSFNIKEKNIDKLGVYHKKCFYHSSCCSFFSNNNNKTKILHHYDLMEFLDRQVEKHLKGRGVIIHGVKYIYQPVKEKNMIYLCDRVYCLNVNNNHNFICNGKIVHNCIGGRLPNLILDHDVPGANDFVRWCIKIFGKENFALELQPSDSEEQIAVNKVLVKFANHYNIPYIVTTDSHYLDKEDFKIHSAFLNSKQTSDRETEKFYKYTYMMTQEEMVELLTLEGRGISREQAEQAILNTELVGNVISEYDFRHGTIVPQIKIPKYKLNFSLYHKGYNIIDKFYDSEDEQDKYLIYQIEQGIINKRVTIDDEKLNRIEYELDILDFISERLKQPLSAYLNLTVNIVDLAWKVSLVGVGRGSACGFFINYLIGITQANPLTYDLPAWRFINKERAELPKPQHWAV